MEGGAQFIEWVALTCWWYEDISYCLRAWGNSTQRRPPERGSRSGCVHVRGHRAPQSAYGMRVQRKPLALAAVSGQQAVKKLWMSGARGLGRRGRTAVGEIGQDSLKHESMQDDGWPRVLRFHLQCSPMVRSSVGRVTTREQQHHSTSRGVYRQQCMAAGACGCSGVSGFLVLLVVEAINFSVGRSSARR